ncbi:sirohydrochlorin chelatase [Microlunatus sp. Y2014]|uniref:sirohydrochlorin chelatase n=1 Tax=Microlunatus sp. Y2014 TaxID=3418488 RepID=UPI003DA74C4A
MTTGTTEPTEPAELLPVLLACPHGTSSLPGRTAITALVDAVAAALPRVEVRQSYVDVEQPSVPDALADLADREVVVVPLLLAAGYHVHVDLAAAVDGCGNDRVRLAAALGPDPRIAEVLHQRLRETDWRPGDHVVVASAGSSDARAVADGATATELLAARIRGTHPEHPADRVHVSYLAAGEPRTAAVADRLRATGERVVVVSHLLAPGFFAGIADRTGPVVSRPLLRPDQPAPVPLVDLVVDRFNRA